MNNIKFTLYHPGLDLLSDKTFRFLLKKMSTLSREIQTKEVLYLIDQDSNLTTSEKQSLRDRLKEPLKHIPTAYYIEKIERGSLDIAIYLSTHAFSILDGVISSFIFTAITNIEFRNSIVNYFKTEKRQVFVKEQAKNTIETANFGRFYLEEYRFEIIHDQNIELFLHIETPEEIEISIENIKYDVDHIIKINEEKILSIKTKKV